MAGNDQSTFGINLGGNAAEAAKTTAGALEQLRERMAAGTDAIKGMQQQLRFLRGSSDDVRQAKDQLKAKLDAERASLSAAAVQLQKQGTNYADLTAQTKKLAAEKDKLADSTKKSGEDAAQARTKAFGAAISAAGGPVASLKSKLGALKEIAGEGGAGGSMSFLALAAAGTVAALAALTVGVIAITVSLAKFIIVGADAARSASLLREAAMRGNQQWGKNFGEQIDALAKTVPTSKAELDKLGISLAKNNIGGQLWVDTMTAVAQASAALGDEAGNKLKEFAERGRQMNRLQINPLEMVGTGLDFEPIAKAVAAGMKVTVQQARAALVEGRVPLGKGMQIIGEEMKRQFGKINLRQMLSLENISKKFGETLSALTKDVDLEPLVESIKDIASVFDLSTVSGQAMKQLVTVIGNDLGLSFKSAAPLGKKFIYGLILGAQSLIITYLQARNAIRNTFSDSKTLEGVNGLKIAAQAGEVAVKGIAVAVVAVGLVAAVAAAQVGALIAAIFVLPQLLAKMGESIGKTLRGIDWKGIGLDIVNGLLMGLKFGATNLVKGVKGMADLVKKTFTGEMEIHSPSKVAKGWGANIAQGTAGGIDDESGRVQRATEQMAPAAPSAGGSSAGAPRGALTINVPVTIQVAAGAGGAEAAAAVSDPSVLEQLTKAVLDACNQMGMAVPS